MPPDPPRRTAPRVGAPRALRAPALHRLARRLAGGDDHEAQHLHERLRAGRRLPPVRAPAILVDRDGRGPPLRDPPVQDDAPAPRGLLGGSQELGEINQRAADDDEVLGGRAQPPPGPPPWPGAASGRPKAAARHPYADRRHERARHAHLILSSRMPNRVPGSKTFLRGPEAPPLVAASRWHSCRSAVVGAAADAARRDQVRPRPRAARRPGPAVVRP